jgi:hypothetical protein
MDGNAQYIKDQRLRGKLSAFLHGSHTLYLFYYYSFDYSWFHNRYFGESTIGAMIELMFCSPCCVIWKQKVRRRGSWYKTYVDVGFSSMFFVVFSHFKHSWQHFPCIFPNGRKMILTIAFPLVFSRRIGGCG